MLDQIFKFLSQYRNGISLEELEEFIMKNSQISCDDILKESDIFKLQKGIVFFKSSVKRARKEFLKEFNDFLHGKLSSAKARTDLINHYLLLISDVLFVKWVDTSLEHKIIIFELLYSIIMKPKKSQKKFLIYFNDFIEYYITILVYSIILLSINDYNFHTLKLFKEIEEKEKVLAQHLFNFLTIPEIVNDNLKQYHEELEKCKLELRKIFHDSFEVVNKYSHKLIRRVVMNEFKELDFLVVLSRFNYDSFYDWVTVLMEEKFQFYNDLFSDL